MMTVLTTLAQMPPGLVLILGGMLLPALPHGLRQLAVLALPLLCLALVWQVPDGTVLTARGGRRQTGSGPTQRRGGSRSRWLNHHRWPSGSTQP